MWTFPLLAHGAAEARVAGAPVQGAAVEVVLELLDSLASQASIGRPHFCWILSLYHSGMTLKLQKGMILRSGVR
jgi:hypothetical protein